MAFKMKGSPHKMGKIQGTSEHASALKQKEAAEASPLEQNVEEDKTPQAVKDLGLSDITDDDLERGIREDKQMADIPESRYKTIVKKYIRGGKLTKEELDFMNTYKPE